MILTRYCKFWSTDPLSPPDIDYADRVHNCIYEAQCIARALTCKSTGLWQKYNKLRAEAKQLTLVKDMDGARSPSSRPFHAEFG